MKAVKRAKLQEAQSPTEEKEPKLKCHEMRKIFQRLPTSELVRFISNLPKHPLGKFWSQELKFVVERRLPFSIKATTTPRGAVSNHVIFDCNGSRVAEIRRPEQFHLSPLCELIEIAEVPAIAPDASSLPPRFVYPTPGILAVLTNLDSLTLSMHFVTRPDMRDPVDLPVALSAEVMSRMRSLTLATTRYHHDYERSEKSILEIISRATSLRKLSLPSLDQSSQALLAALRDSTRLNSNLESLTVTRLDLKSIRPLLETITTRFNGLHELFLALVAPIRRYLAAFHALPSLTTLSLAASDLYKVEEQNETVLPIVSVTEFNVAWISSACKEPRALLAMLSNFPNVRLLGVDFYAHEGHRTSQYSDFMLQFVSTVCVSRVFAQLQALKLFCNASLIRYALLQFICANIDHLPSSVDLAQVKTVRPQTVDADFWIDLCEALQGGRITSLALKDLVSREAVPRLRERFALTNLDKSRPEAKVGKVLAWIDEGSIDERRKQSRAVWWPETVSEFTDFRIEARKTSGPLKGSAFNLRISNWTEKRERFFDE